MLFHSLTSHQIKFFWGLTFMTNWWPVHKETGPLNVLAIAPWSGSWHQCQTDGTEVTVSTPRHTALLNTQHFPSDQGHLRCGHVLIIKYGKEPLDVEGILDTFFKHVSWDLHVHWGSSIKQAAKCWLFFFSFLQLNWLFVLVSRIVSGALWWNLFP